MKIYHTKIPRENKNIPKLLTKSKNISLDGARNLSETEKLDKYS